MVFVLVLLRVPLLLFVKILLRILQLGLSVLLRVPSCPLWFVLVFLFKIFSVSPCLRGGFWFLVVAPLRCVTVAPDDIEDSP